MPVSDHGDSSLPSVEASTHHTSTPLKGNDQPSADAAIASSPLLRDIGSSPLKFLNEQTRDSQASSFRLSRDMSSLRYDGSDIGEDELEEADQDTEVPEDNSVAGDFDDESEQENDPSGQGLGAAHYSTLSKRADFILAHAKKKLNLLEGNLGKARHSLSSPTIAVPEPRTTSSLSNYASPALVEITDEADGTVKISPRINFGTPRHLRSSPIARSPSGHLRMFSDTSVPSPAGAKIKGGRSLDQIQNEELRKQAVLSSEQTTGLKTVDEHEESNKGSTIQNFRELDGASSPPPKSTQELRNQADELRSRIAFLQMRSKHATNDSHHLVDGGSEQAFLSQVEALKQSLESQEEVIAQLENAKRPRGILREDPRGEWQQVLESNQARADGEGLSDDEYFEDDEELLEDLPNVLGYDDVDETRSMAAAHEDRVDAFDYETFILHSAMGRGVERSSSPAASSSSDHSTSADSEGSVATEKGAAPAEDEPQTTSGEEQHHSWEHLQHSNESFASLTTMQSFETANEDIASDFGSDESEQQHEDLLQTGLENTWPMPPQPMNGHLQRFLLSEKEGPAPKAGAHSREQIAGLTAPTDKTGRPLSSIFQTLLVPEDSSELPRTLDKSDAELIRRCADSLRSVCLEAIHPTTSPRDMKALRERLEVAKRVLNGEL